MAAGDLWLIRHEHSIIMLIQRLLFAEQDLPFADHCELEDNNGQTLGARPGGLCRTNREHWLNPRRYSTMIYRPTGFPAESVGRMMIAAYKYEGSPYSYWTIFMFFLNRIFRTRFFTDRFVSATRFVCSSWLAYLLAKHLSVVILDEITDEPIEIRSVAPDDLHDHVVRDKRWQWIPIIEPVPLIK